MPEWHKIRAAIANGAASIPELAAQFDVVPGTISAALRRMPDGQEQRTRMNSNQSPAAPFPPRGPEVEMPEEAARQLRAFAPHYDDYPAPKELANLTARLLYIGVSMGLIAKTTGCPFYVVQGWAAQAGYFTEATLARHAEIREAIECGAESLQDVADLTGLARERVRQLTYSMPDQEIVYRRLNVRLRRPNTAPAKPEAGQQMIDDHFGALPAPRTLTNHERQRLLQVIERARNVPRNGTPQQRRLLIVRDQYIQKLHQEGISIAALAEATGEHADSIRDWTSPAKTYRRQLITKAIAREKRAKRRS